MYELLVISYLAVGKVNGESPAFVVKQEANIATFDECVQKARDLKSRVDPMPGWKIDWGCKPSQ
jgi:hypothetical protein